MTERERAELLDRCVEDVRSGRRTVAECLESVGDERAELQGLLPLALAMVPPQVHIDPAAAATNGAALLA
jgi:hypothetical protein